MRMIRKIRLQDFSPSLPWNTPQRSKAPLTLGWQQHPRGKRVLSGAGCYVRGGTVERSPVFISCHQGTTSFCSKQRAGLGWGFFPFNSVWHRMLRGGLPALRAPLPQLRAAVPRPPRQVFRGLLVQHSSATGSALSCWSAQAGRVLNQPLKEKHPPPL